MIDLLNLDVSKWWRNEYRIKWRPFSKKESFLTHAKL